MAESYQKILVTGASGKLGQQLIYQLIAEGHQPIAQVRETSDTTFLDSLGVEKRVADLRNREQMATLVSGVDAIINTAAWVDFRKDKLTQFTGINTVAAVDLYSAAQRAGVRRFVQISSIVGVGAIPVGENNHASLNIRMANEETMFNIGNVNIPYIMTKHAADVELARAAAVGQPVLVTVNPSVIVSPSVGESDRARFRQMFSHWFLPELNILVNFVDVRDVAIGTVAALHRGRSGERYILGGDNLPMREVVLAISAFVGRAPHLVRLPRALLRLIAKFWVVWSRLTGRSKLTFYPDLLKILNYDWVYSSSKAIQELEYHPRSIYSTLNDLLTDSMGKSYAKE